MKRNFSPHVAFTLLQGITVLLSVVGAALSGTLLYVGVGIVLDHSDFPMRDFWPLMICGFTSVIVVSVCCAISLVRFFLLCQRLKQNRIFIRQNQRTMGVIALCLLTAGQTLTAAASVLAALSITGLFLLEMFLAAFLFLAVAAVCWALYLLVRRAVPMQEEADLTV